MFTRKLKLILPDLLIGLAIGGMAVYCYSLTQTIKYLNGRLDVMYESQREMAAEVYGPLQQAHRLSIMNYQMNEDQQGELMKLFSGNHVRVIVEEKND